MTNKQLQGLLKQLPDDYEVVTEHYGALEEEPKGFLFDVKAQGIYVNHLQKQIKVHTHPICFEKANKILGKRAELLYDYYQEQGKPISEVIEPSEEENNLQVVIPNWDKMTDEEVLRNINVDGTVDA